MRIGIFDSGVGGITVLTALQQRFKFANFVYLGDTAHVPYGTKSPAQIKKLSIQCAKVLKKKKVNAVVIACNTASSYALESVQETMGACVPVYGVVYPGVQAALAAYQDFYHEDAAKNEMELKRVPILILATRATVQSHAYLKAFQQAQSSDHPIEIIEQACPLLVPMIEEGWIDHPILHQTIWEYVHSYAKKYSFGVALLGCTHYPWIHKAFENALPGWKVVNSAQAVAESLENTYFWNLNSSRLPKRVSKSPEEKRMEWIFTDPEAVPGFAKKLLESE